MIRPEKEVTKMIDQLETVIRDDLVKNDRIGVQVRHVINALKWVTGEKESPI